ncbi:hypothetical protein ACK3TF_004657 [Chlorella vulgaris]
MPVTSKLNTGAKDPASGRTVWRGPRGGLYTVNSAGRRQAMVGISDLPQDALNRVFAELGTPDVQRAGVSSHALRSVVARTLEKRTKASKDIQKAWKRFTELRSLIAQAALAYMSAQASPRDVPSPAVMGRLRKLRWRALPDEGFHGHRLARTLTVGPGLLATAYFYRRHNGPGISITLRSAGRGWDIATSVGGYPPRLDDGKPPASFSAADKAAVRAAIPVARALMPAFTTAVRDAFH